MTLDWLETWWEHYGNRNRLRIFLFRRGARLVGILPLYLETFGIGPLKAVIARIVGANIPPRCFNPPVDPGCVAEIFACVYRQLFVDEGCDLFSFGPVSERWAASTAFETGGSLPGRTASRTADVQTVIDISPDFVRTLVEKKSVKRYLREFEKRRSITTDVVTEPAELEKCFEAFARQHAEQWRAMGKGGHFVAWPGGLDYHRALIGRQARLGRVRFYRILDNGEMIAGVYAFLFGATLSWELSSRALGPEWNKFHLGKAALVQMFQDAAGAGVSTVDAGLGHYEYKVNNLGGTEVPARMLQIVPCRWSCRVKSAAFLAVKSLMRILYHKIWYRRVVPRLPEWVGRSQSRFWLRFEA